jgi:hypothetical protein
LLSPALDQTRIFQLAGGIADGWSLDAEHVSKEMLRDQVLQPAPFLRLAW